MEKEILKDIFLSHDIRGIYGKVLTKEFGETFGLAVASYFGTGSLVIGGDTRPSTVELKDSIIKGLLLGGISVYDLGVVPTPCIYYTCAKNTNFTGGIIVTASHNPIEYNGVKFCDKNGQAYSYNSFFSKILNIIITKAYQESHTEGELHISPYLVDEYTAFLRSLCKFKNDLNVAVEFGNGATSLFGQVIENKTNFVSLGEGLDMNSQQFTDPAKGDTYLNLQQLMKNSKCKIGIVFDPDGDRVGFVDETGKIIPTSIITMLFIEKISKTTQPKILIDVKLSQAIMDFGAKLDAIVEFTPVGHSIIHHNLVSKNYHFASELSCHYYFNLNYYGFDDGLYMAIQFLNLFDKILTENSSLSEKIANYPQYFPSAENRVKLPKNTINNIINKLHTIAKKMNGKLILLDGIRCETSEGWFLARASNTESLLSYRVEGKTEKVRDYFLNLVQSVIDEEIVNINSPK